MAENIVKNKSRNFALEPVFKTTIDITYNMPYNCHKRTTEGNYGLPNRLDRQSMGYD